MKTIGLIGGTSWESTVTYYQLINEYMKAHLGGLHSAKCVLYSVEFAELESHMSKLDWAACGDIMAGAAKSLQNAGADFVLICSNTLHNVVEKVQSEIDVPVVHIADATAEALLAGGVKKAALLGTKYTMEQDFIKSRLVERGIEVLVPDKADIELLNSIIFDELCVGVLKESSRKEMLRVTELLAQRGAQGAILGCTEIGLLINQADTAVPLYDTTVIHAEKAARLALE